MNFATMILDLADDDYTGLWELVWRAQTLEPSADVDNLRASLQDELEGLARGGKVKFVRGTHFSGDERLIPLEGTRAMLADRRSWEPPEMGEVHVRVLTIRIAT
jgi:hypothetical protein